MNNTPQRIKKVWAQQPMPECARKSDECSGKITKEHALIYAGRQVQELWAIIDLCWYHHLGAGLNKRVNELIALRQATDEDLAKYPKRDWRQHHRYLENNFNHLI